MKAFYMYLIILVLIIKKSFGEVSIIKIGDLYSNFTKLSNYPLNERLEWNYISSELCYLDNSTDCKDKVRIYLFLRLY